MVSEPQRNPWLILVVLCFGFFICSHGFHMRCSSTPSWRRWGRRSTCPSRWCCWLRGDGAAAAAGRHAFGSAGRGRRNRGQGGRL